MGFIKGFLLWRLKRRIKYLEEEALLRASEVYWINHTLLPELRRKKNNLDFPMRTPTHT